MPNYSYKAVDQSGVVKSGVRFAASVSELRAMLRQSGLSLLKARQGKGWEDIIDAISTLQIGSLSRAQLIEFNYNMGVMLKAGVPLASALKELREDTSDKYVIKILEELHDNISAGDTLHQAMARRPRDFSALYLSLIKIGEETGNLTDVFFNISKHYKRIDHLVKSTKKAMIYPSFIMVSLFASIIVFMLFVLPPITDVLKEINFDTQRNNRANTIQEMNLAAQNPNRNVNPNGSGEVDDSDEEYRGLPPQTVFVIKLSDFIKERWHFIVSTVILFVILFVFLRRIPRVKFILDWILLKIPYIGKLTIQIHMTYYLRYFSLMLYAGVDILTSVVSSASAVTNSKMQQDLIDVKGRIQEGALLSHAFKQAGYLPNTVIRMIAVGETSGNLPEQMDYLAEEYNENIERLMEAALDVLQPSAIIIMACLAGFVIWATLGPIYGLVGKMQSMM